MNYIMKKLNETSFWLGVTGLIVWVFLPKSWLLLFFIAQIILPDAQFSQLAKKGKDAVSKGLDNGDA